MSVGLSEEDRKKLQEFRAHQQEKGRTPGNPLDCESIRRAFQNGDTVECLSERYDRSRETIRKHLVGDCECVGVVDGLDTLGDRWSREAVCPREDCGRAYHEYAKLSEHINEDHQ